MSGVKKLGLFIKKTGLLDCDYMAEFDGKCISENFSLNHSSISRLRFLSTNFDVNFIYRNVVNSSNRPPTTEVLA